MKTEIDVAGAMAVLGCFVCMLLFWGEPDVLDGIRHQLSGLPIETFIDE